MLTKNQKITIAMIKNRGFDVGQIIQHFINTSQKATSWYITIHWIELCDKEREQCFRKIILCIKNM